MFGSCIVTAASCMHPDVTVALLQTAFIIGEEQAPINATICSILLALSEREVLVTLSTLNGTAQGR